MKRKLVYPTTIFMFIFCTLIFTGCMKPAVNAEAGNATASTINQADQPEDLEMPDSACNGRSTSQAKTPPHPKKMPQYSTAPPPPPKQAPSYTSAMPMQQPPPTARSYTMDDASLFNADVHDIAIQLIENMNADAGIQGVIGVSTFVDLNYLYRTSPLGRYLAEQLMGELQRAGYQVVEIRKTDAILIKKKFGEYSLSRELDEIANHTSANIILVGTYIVKGNYVFINARLVSTDSGMVASSAMKIIPNNKFMRSMLWPSSAPPEMNKRNITIPIKRFGEPTEVRIIQGS